MGLKELFDQGFNLTCFVYFFWLAICWNLFGQLPLVKMDGGVMFDACLP